MKMQKKLGKPFKNIKEAKALLEKDLKQCKLDDKLLKGNGLRKIKSIPCSANEVVEVKKRGRPKKVIVEKKKEETIVISSSVHKHMGYCGKCEALVGDIDCTETNYKCKGCGETGLMCELKKERKMEKRSKKEDWEWINSLSTGIKEV